MSFDKVKAMRSAERFLSQGKIRSAISEYKQVVENDPRDFSTLNMLGDLYAKNSEEREAVGCFRRVAEHYSKQGFAQKAIAVYNKISRIQPDSLEVSAKLAELYQMKGSIVEARAHYLTLAERYQNKGKKLEAVAVWKQIAELDATNTDIYLKIAEVYWEENQKEEAASAFTQAGLRFAAQDLHEAALTAFSRALEIMPNDPVALNAQIKSQISLGYSEDAAKTLENILEEQPDNKDIFYLLADCYLDMNNPWEAEKVITRLLEREPADYPKLLNLTEVYLKNNDLESAVRILLVTSEQLLASGEADHLMKWLNEILARDPEQIDALRLLVRASSWQRNEDELKEALERLAEAARANDSIDDERYALSQLVLIAPQEKQFAQRLQEIITEFGYIEVEPISPVVDEKKKRIFSEASYSNQDTSTFETFEILSREDDHPMPISSFESFETTYSGINAAPEYQPADVSGNGSNGLYGEEQIFEDHVLEAEIPADEFEIEEIAGAVKLTPSEEYSLQQELEGVEFYIAQGYKDLARNTLDELESKYGSRTEFAKMREELDDSLQTLAEKTKPEPAITEVSVEVKPADQPDDVKGFDLLNEFRDELGLEDTAAAEVEGDYETHYHLAIAYREMGLMEESIKEFQDAVNLVDIDDGTRRFFHCANLLGLCFMEKQMPNLALLWYRKALETKNLNDEERQALMYEIAIAYEFSGEEKKAREYFEQVYVVDVDYRDVSKRLQSLQQKIIH